MNYYEHHLGDYMRDASYLSMVEEGAYRRLLDAYYIAEKPLPTDVLQCIKISRAAKKSEQDAVKYVLGKFFEKRPDGYHQARADKEIARFLEKRSKAKASADARWTHTERNADAMRSHSERNAHQSPVTSHQLKNRKTTSSSSPDKLTTDVTDKPSIPNCQYAEVVGLYHDKLPTLPRCKLLPESRKRAIAKVWKWSLTSKKPDGSRRATNAEEALAWFSLYFDRASANDFIMGRTRKSGDHANWKADLDFLLSEKGMKQVIEKTETD